MLKKSKITWVVAVTAVAAMMTAGAVSASSFEAGGATINRTATRDVRALLLPIESHPAGHLIGFEASLQQLGGASLPGVVWSPGTCEDFLEVAVPGIGSANGWLRATDRQSPDFDHDNFFLEMVAEVNADPNRVRAAALSCGAGTVKLDGTVTGSVSNASAAVPAQPGASTVGLSTKVSFPAPANAEQAAILAKHGYGTEGGAAFITIKQIIIIITSGLLYMAHSPDGNVTTEVASAFVKAVQAS